MCLFAEVGLRSAQGAHASYTHASYTPGLLWCLGQTWKRSPSSGLSWRTNLSPWVRQAATRSEDIGLDLGLDLSINLCFASSVAICVDNHHVTLCFCTFHTIHPHH